MDDKSGFTEQMPQIIGRYQVQESVGYGAMGAVYKAFDPLIKRTLAIKTIRLDIPKQSPQYKSFIERFYHEARISGTLSHPNIVTLFDIGEEGGIPYLAMEFVEGETIASLIDKGVRFPPEKVIGLISQIASAVDYAHSRGVIHRDIKPSNLILFEGDRVKVTDFGIAKLVDAEMTQSGTLLGTPSYMSPEQAMGDKLDGRSDIFSLGVCAFEMLSGEQPFPGNNVTSILYKLVHVDPIEPPNLEMHGLVPQRWHEVFGRVLAKKPDERYQTATEFVQDLEYCLGSWFGAAMDTVADGTAALPMPGGPDGESVTRAIPRIEEEPGDHATTALPALGLSAVPAAPPRGSHSAGAVAEEESPETVSLQAPSEEAIAAATAAVSAGGVEKTIMMRADQIPGMVKAAPPPGTVRSEKPATGPAEKTVLMKASDLPPAPPKARAASSAPAAPPPAPAEKTVMMASPVATAKGSAELPTLRPTNELTVKTPSPLSAPTVRSTVPPGSRTIPPLPKAAEPPRPLSVPPPVPPAPASKVPPPPKPLAVPVGPVAEEMVEAAEPPRRSGVSTGLVLGLAGFAAVLLFAAIAVWVYRSFGGSDAPSPAPTAAPEAATATPTPAPVVAPSVDPTPALTTFAGALHVESQPAGAQVTVDGEARGVTPLDLTDLPEGVHLVRLELKGYEAKTQSVTLTPDAASQEVKVAMQRSGPAMGTADILSTPFGATVTLDGNRLGLTPLTDHRVKVGSYQIELTKEGYEPFSASLRVEAGKRARVDALLRAVVKATPAPPPADKVDPTKVYQPSEIDTQPRRLTGGSAQYPDSAPRMRSGDSVSVSLSFVITEDGEVADIKVTESGGKALDDAVTAAVQKWKYAPGIKKGVKVKVRSGAKQTFRAG